MLKQNLLVSFAEYLAGTGMAPATVLNYLADIRGFSNWFDSLHLGDAVPLNVSADHIRHYCEVLRLQRRSVSTINRRLQALRKFYDFVEHVGLSSHNPARDVERLGERCDDCPRVLTAGEADELLCAVNGSKGSLVYRDRAILLLLLRTGLKVGELVGLRVSDVELNGSSGYVFAGRDPGPGRRCLAIDSEVCVALRACMRTRASDHEVEHLFVSRRGRPLSIRSVQRLVSNHAQVAGLEGVCSHTLRHTFAHSVLERTRDLAEVARILGLRDVTGVRRYLG